MIKGVCWEHELGTELSFDVKISEIKLGVGYIQFNKDKNIVYYKGPIIDILSEFLSKKEARLLAEKECTEEDLYITDSSPYPSYNDEYVFWRFELDGEMPEYCFFAECFVNANTGKAKIEWRCGGMVG